MICLHFLWTFLNITAFCLNLSDQAKTVFIWTYSDVRDFPTTIETVVAKFIVQFCYRCLVLTSTNTNSESKLKLRWILCKAKLLLISFVISEIRRIPIGKNDCFKLFFTSSKWSTKPSIKYLTEFLFSRGPLAETRVPRYGVCVDVSCACRVVAFSAYRSSLALLHVNIAQNFYRCSPS